MPAIGELKSYCPASEIENIFADYAGTVEPEKTFLAPGEKFVSQMNLLGFKTGRLSAVEKKSPNFWPRYLDKKRSEAPARNLLKPSDSVLGTGVDCRADSFYAVSLLTA